MSIRNRLAGTVLATTMALTAVGGFGVSVASANSGHGGPLEAIADIEDAQASYVAGRFLIANQQAVIALRALRHLGETHASIPLLVSIGCQDEYVIWWNKAITKMAALRAVAFGQGTNWVWAASPRLEKVLATNVYRRAAFGYDTAENAFIDCVLNAVQIPPDFILELAF